MAKLRFGEITLEAAPLREMPRKFISEEPNGTDIKSIVEKAIAMLPKPKEMEHQDLSYLETAISSQAARLMEHNDRLILLEKKENQFAPVAQLLATPEVKHITHVKDVSKEVMEHVEANKQANKADYMCHANHIVAIEAKLKTQKVINIILIGAILITLLYFRGGM